MTSGELCRAVAKCRSADDRKTDFWDAIRRIESMASVESGFTELVPFDSR